VSAAESRARADEVGAGYRRNFIAGETAGFGEGRCRSRSSLNPAACSVRTTNLEQSMEASCRLHVACWWQSSRSDNASKWREAAAARSRGTLAKRNDQPRIDVARTEQSVLTAARRCAAPRCGGGRAGQGVGLPGRRRLRCGRRPRRRALDRSRGPGRDAPAATRRRR
jgi:hypothetical protein